MPEDIQDMQSYVKDLAKKVDALQGAVSSLQAKNQVLETTNIQLSDQMQRMAAPSNTTAIGPWTVSVEERTQNLHFHHGSIQRLGIDANGGLYVPGDISVTGRMLISG
ncbi:hypothetical protein HDU78_006601 [Chytriomyces hyalinus]|nr:hypothetical protein HDU78_006601 [Chytriomyces hyalinus]